MSKSQLLQSLAEQPLVLREKKVVMTQPDKNCVIARKAVKRLHRDRACPRDGLERDCIEAGLTGRIAVNIGFGVSGENGMRLHLDKKKAIIFCRENVQILLHWIGDAGLPLLCAELGVTEEELQSWFQELPAL